MTNLTIEYLLTEQLIAYTGNARTHSPQQIQQIVKSIRAFGWMNPLLIDAKNQLIAGHGLRTAEPLPEYSVAPE